MCFAGCDDDWDIIGLKVRILRSFSLSGLIGHFGGKLRSCLTFPFIRRAETVAERKHIGAQVYELDADWEDEVNFSHNEPRECGQTHNTLTYNTNIYISNANRQVSGSK